MKGYSIEERAIELAHYIIDSKDTVRGAAKKFGVSKSTVHKDLSERILKINPMLAAEVREILDENKAERHIRGGMATKLKYSHLKQDRARIKNKKMQVMHLFLYKLVIKVSFLCFSSSSTSYTSLWFVCKSFFSIKFLFTSCENEFSTTIFTY